MRASLLFSALSLVVPLQGCGGPATPSPPSAPTRVDFAITPEVQNRSALEMRWESTAGASGYRVEVGTRSGASDVAVLQAGAAATTIRHTPVPLGTLFFRVRAQGASGDSDPSLELRPESVDPRHVIEALFLATGPLKATADAPRPIMLSWIPLEPIRFVVARSITDGQYAGIAETVAQLPEGTAGKISGTIRRTEDPDPEPGFGEVTFATLPDAAVQELCQNPSAAGCTIFWLVTSRFIRSVRVVGAARALGPGLFAHELGHAAFGFSHIRVPQGFWPAPVMAAEGFPPDPTYPQPPLATGPPTRLRPSEIRASAAVYAAGLIGGATRAEFEAAGLVGPEGVTTARAPATTLFPGSRAKVLPGGDVVVIKPFCLQH